MAITDIERQLLEYLHDHPRGVGLVCEPTLCAVIDRLVFDDRRLLGSVYEGPDGSRIAQIAQAGRAAIGHG